MASSFDTGGTLTSVDGVTTTGVGVPANSAGHMIKCFGATNDTTDLCTLHVNETIRDSHILKVNVRSTRSACIVQTVFRWLRA